MPNPTQSANGTLGVRTHKETKAEVLKDGNFMARPIYWLREPSSSKSETLKKVLVVTVAVLLIPLVVGMVLGIAGAVEWNRQVKVQDELDKEIPLQTMKKVKKQTTQAAGAKKTTDQDSAAKKKAELDMAAADAKRKAKAAQAAADAKRKAEQEAAAEASNKNEEALTLLKNTFPAQKDDIDKLIGNGMEEVINEFANLGENTPKEFSDALHQLERAFQTAEKSVNDGTVDILQEIQQAVEKLNQAKQAFQTAINNAKVKIEEAKKAKQAKEAALKELEGLSQSFAQEKEIASTLSSQAKKIQGGLKKLNLEYTEISNSRQQLKEALKQVQDLIEEGNVNKIQEINEALTTLSKAREDLEASIQIQQSILDEETKKAKQDQIGFKDVISNAWEQNKDAAIGDKAEAMKNAVLNWFSKAQ